MTSTNRLEFNSLTQAHLRKPRVLFDSSEVARRWPQLSWTDLGLALTPKPPQIPPGELTEEHAAFCVRWLKAHCDHFLKFYPYAYTSRKKHSKQKYWGSFRDAMEVLRERGVSPVRWIIWNREESEESVRAKPHAVANIYSVTRVTRQVDKLLKSGLPEPGKVIVTTDSYKKYVACDNYMKRAIANATCLEDIDRAREQVYPANRLANLKARINSEALLEKIRLEKAVESFEWIW